MDSKELRIDNFIRLKENGNIFDVQVVGTRCESIDVYNNGIYTSYLKNIDYYLEPIPLTEEWLVKFGFKIVVKNAEKNGVLICYNIKEKTYDFVLRDSFYNKKFTVSKLKHVHQLQNLYFALTNEELTIKE